MTSATRPAPRHNRRFPALIASALFLSTLAFAFACGSDSSSPTSDVASLSATSGDTTASVEIPEGALPSGVSPSDITITSLDIDEAFEGWENVEPLGAYRFGPDNLQLNTPLRVTIEAPISQANVIARLVSSDGAAELLQPVRLQLQPTSDRMMLVYEIAHFSDFHVLLDKGGAPPRMLVVPPPPNPTYLVGESFTVRVRIHAGYSDWTTITSRGGQVTRKAHSTLRDKPWHAQLSWLASAPRAHSEDNIIDVLIENSRDGIFLNGGDLPTLRNDPPLEPQRVEERVDGPDTFTAAFAEQTFTCKQAGDFTLNAVAIAKMRAQVGISVDGDTPTVSEYEQDLVSFLTEPIFGRCIEAETSTAVPITAAIAPGDYVIRVDYTNGQGSCGYPTEFDDALILSVDDEFALSITQPSTGDANTGTIDPATGTFTANQASPPESYEGTLDPTTGSGTGVNTYTDSGGCTSSWEVTWPALEQGVVCVELLGRRDCSLQ